MAVCNFPNVTSPNPKYVITVSPDLVARGVCLTSNIVGRAVYPIHFRSKFAVVKCQILTLHRIPTLLFILPPLITHYRDEICLLCEFSDASKVSHVLTLL